MDFLHQRPLIFWRKAWCAPKHYTYEEAVERWQAANGAAPIPYVKPTQARSLRRRVPFAPAAGGEEGGGGVVHCPPCVAAL